MVESAGSSYYADVVPPEFHPAIDAAVDAVAVYGIIKEIRLARARYYLSTDPETDLLVARVKTEETRDGPRIGKVTMGAPDRPQVDLTEESTLQMMRLDDLMQTVELVRNDGLDDTQQQWLTRMLAAHASPGVTYETASELIEAFPHTVATSRQSTLRFGLPRGGYIKLEHNDCNDLYAYLELPSLRSSRSNIEVSLGDGAVYVYEMDQDSERRLTVIPSEPVASQAFEGAAGDGLDDLSEEELVDYILSVADLEPRHSDDALPMQAKVERLVSRLAFVRQVLAP